MLRLAAVDPFLCDQESKASPTGTQSGLGSQKTGCDLQPSPVMSALLTNNKRADKTSEGLARQVKIKGLGPGWKVGTSECLSVLSAFQTSVSRNANPITRAKLLPATLPC